MLNLTLTSARQYHGDCYHHHKTITTAQQPHDQLHASIARQYRIITILASSVVQYHNSTTAANDTGVNDTAGINWDCHSQWQ
jgi:hypothetical protein